MARKSFVSPLDAAKELDIGYARLLAAVRRGDVRAMVIDRGKRRIYRIARGEITRMKENQRRGLPLFWFRAASEAR